MNAPGPGRRAGITGHSDVTRTQEHQGSRPSTVLSALGSTWGDQGLRHNDMKAASTPLRPGSGGAWVTAAG